MSKLTYVFLVAVLVGLGSSINSNQSLKDEKTPGNYSGWGYMVSTKGSDQFRAKDAKGFKYVLYGKNIYTSRSFGKK